MVVVCRFKQRLVKMKRTAKAKRKEVAGENALAMNLTLHPTTMEKQNSFVANAIVGTMGLIWGSLVPHQLTKMVIVLRQGIAYHVR